MSAIDSQAVVQDYAEWAARELDIEVPADPPIDRIFSCPVRGKGKRNRDGRGRIYIDGGRPSGWAQNWTNGDGAKTWTFGRDKDFSPAEREAARAQIRAAQTERKAEDAKVKAAAAELSARILKEDTAPCTVHPYTTRKGVQVHALLMTKRKLRLLCRDGKTFLTIPAASLVVPLSDVRGKLWSLQFIDKDGHKWFMPCAQKRGLLFLLGKLTGKPGEVVLVAEGFATAATLHEATGHPLIIAFDCDNMQPALEAFRAKHPDAKLVVCPDDDHHRANNPGLTCGTKAAKTVGALFCPPDLGPAKQTGATDYNDWAKSLGPGGLDVIKMHIENALAQTTADRLAESAPITRAASSYKPEKITWLQTGVVAKGEPMGIVGQAGLGKSTWSDDFAARSSTGSPQYGCTFARPPADALIYAPEESIQHVLLDKLKAAEANLDRIHFWPQEDTLQFPQDVDRYLAEVKKLPNCEVAIFDPIISTLQSGLNANTDADIRRAFTPLFAGLRALGVASISIRHPNKKQGVAAIDKASGSPALTALLRTEFYIGRADEDPSLLTMACSKTNLGRMPQVIQFRLSVVGDTIKVVYVGRSDTTANDLVADPMVRAARVMAKADAIEDLIRKIGADGVWHTSAELDFAVKKSGGSIATLRRVKDKLGVKSERQKQPPRAWYWYLPAQGGVCASLDEHLRSDEHLQTHNNNHLESQNAQALINFDISPPDEHLPVPPPDEHLPGSADEAGKDTL